MIKENKKELIPLFENVKSYYKKAYIKKYYNKDNIIIKYELLSYNVKMITLKDNKIIMNKNIKDYTNTTLRHIKEFLKQYNYYISLNYKELAEKEKITKKDILKLI